MDDIDLHSAVLEEVRDLLTTTERPLCDFEAELKSADLNPPLTMRWLEAWRYWPPSKTRSPGGLNIWPRVEDNITIAKVWVLGSDLMLSDTAGSEHYRHSLNDAECFRCMARAVGKLLSQRPFGFHD